MSVDVVRRNVNSGLSRVLGGPGSPLTRLNVAWFGGGTNRKQQERLVPHQAGLRQLAARERVFRDLPERSIAIVNLNDVPGSKSLFKATLVQYNRPLENYLRAAEELAKLLHEHSLLEDLPSWLKLIAKIDGKFLNGEGLNAVRLEGGLKIGAAGQQNLSVQSFTFLPKTLTAMQHRYEGDVDFNKGEANMLFRQPTTNDSGMPPINPSDIEINYKFNPETGAGKSPTYTTPRGTQEPIGPEFLNTAIDTYIGRIAGNMEALNRVMRNSYPPDTNFPNSSLTASAQNS